MSGELARVYEILTSTVCQCGRPKAVYLALCPRCRERLPLEARLALFKRVGEGFAAAYDEACALLGRQADQLELGI